MCVQHEARTVVNAEPGELDTVDEADERDVVGWIDAIVQLPVGSNGIAGIVEFGAVNVGRVGDVDQVSLPVTTCTVSNSFRANVSDS